MADRVRFKAVTQAQHNSLVEPDNGALYFTTDTKRIYKGAVLYGGGGIQSVDYDADDHILTFTNADDTETVIDLPLESVINAISYDEETHVLTITLVNGDTTEISLTDLIGAYTGGDTATAETAVAEDGEITVDVKISEATDNQLTTDAQGLYVAPLSWE